MEKEAENPGFALIQAIERKMRQVGADCEREGIVFLPLPVETFGDWSQGAPKVIRKLGIALANRSKRDEGEVVSHLFQRLSVMLAKGNEALLANHIPTFPSTEIDGDADIN